MRALRAEGGVGKFTKLHAAETGVNIPSVTADEMREIDRIAIAETGPNLFQMMQNAGWNVAGLVCDLLGEDWRRSRVAVLAGTGGNGGGEICAARHLANHGVSVTLCLSDPDRLGQMAACQLHVFRSTSGREAATVELIGRPVDLVIDALIGNSLDSAPRGPTFDLIRRANASGAPILSLDVPSGLNVTSGETPGEFIRPQWTLTPALPKAGLVADRVGELFLGTLGSQRRSTVASERLTLLRSENGSGYACCQFRQRANGGNGYLEEGKRAGIPPRELIRSALRGSVAKG